MQSEAEYLCGNCGETVVIPIDISAGPTQHYVEDCPVCCCGNVLRVTLDICGEINIESELE